MKFLRGPVCRIAATGRARPALAATWKMRCQAAPGAPAGALGTLPTSSPPPGPSQRPELRGGLPHLSRHRRTRKTVQPASAPWRGQAPEARSHPRARRAWPCPLARPAGRRMETGEETRPVPGLVAAPPRAGALHSSLLPASANLLEKRTLASAAGRVGGGVFPSRCFDPVSVTKRSPAPQNPPLRTTSAFPSKWLLR